MDNAIKRLITCTAVGFALVFPFSTKAAACNPEAVLTEDLQREAAPDAPKPEQPAESHQTEQTQNCTKVLEPAQQNSVSSASKQTVIASTETSQNTTSAAADIQEGRKEPTAKAQQSTPLESIETTTQVEIKSAGLSQNATPAVTDTQEQKDEPIAEAAQFAANPMLQKSASTESGNIVSEILPKEAASFTLSTSANAIPMTASMADDEAPPLPSVSMSVGGTTLDSIGDDSGWDGKKGWRYDGQNISMVNNETAVDVHAEGQGVELSAAGFNRIGTLYADGDVNITGTGILLIDTIDMLEGTQLNLLTNTDIYEDGTGSVAVFAKQEDGSYLLINGSVNGILDDTYSIPADVHLVIPKDSSLDMRVLDCVKEVQTCDTGIISQRVLHYGIEPDDYARIGSESAVCESEGISYIYKTLLEVTFPTLTIEEGASLTIAQDGILTMGTTGYKKADADHIRGEVSTLTVKGILELFGKIIGPSEFVTQGNGDVIEAVASDLIPDITVQGNGSVQGSGTFSYVDIRYEGTDQATNSNSSEIPAGSTTPATPTDGIHTGDNCRVIVKGDCPTVYAEGKNLIIIYAEDACMDGIVLADQDNVSVNVYSVSGGKLNLLSEPVDPKHQLHMPESEIFVNGSLYHGNIGEALKSLYPDGWVFDVQTNTYSGGGGFFSALPSEGSHGGKFFYGKIDSITPGESLKYDASANETISFSALHDALDPEGNSNEDYRIFYLKEYTVQSDDGENQTPFYKIETIILNEKSTQTVPRENICGIEMMRYELYATVAPASGSINTSKTNTGAGVLGGSHAGSLAGGAYTPILSGSRAPDSSVGDSNSEAGSSANPDIPTDGVNSDSTVPSDSTGTPDNPDNIKDDTDYTEDIKDEPDAPNDKEAATEDKEIYLDVRVSGMGTHFTVSIYLGNDRLQMLNGGLVQASFQTEIPQNWNRNDLFAVFRNGDGAITAIKICYDPTTGILSFETPILGEFDIICLHWDGDDYTTDAFRTAVEALLDRNK